VVQAVRNYRLLCASANLFRDGHYCDACVGKAVPLPALAHRCYRDSLASTAALVAMQSVHKIMGTWSNRVTRYVALTRYVRDRLVEGGIPADRIVIKPNFVGSLEVSDEDPGIDGPYAVYVGRLTEDKGAAWLARAWIAENFTMPLIFIGHGNALDAIAPGNEAHVRAIGKRTLAQTYRIIRGAEVLVQPALWPEPFGRVVVEAYSLGVPVVCARVGGLQELVRDGVTGFTYKAGDRSGFRDAIHAIMQPERQARMRDAARMEYREKYSPDANFTLMMDIYRDTVASVTNES
jgi:glycosyltransferase involved in cell wall biosynthesis